MSEPQNQRRMTWDELAIENQSLKALIEQTSRHIWHVSQHNRMPIGLAGRLQDIANEMRTARGLPEFGWDDAFPDGEFNECSVHVSDCEGQHTHSVEDAGGTTPPEAPEPMLCIGCKVRYSDLAKTRGVCFDGGPHVWPKQRTSPAGDPETTP